MLAYVKEELMKDYSLMFVVIDNLLEDVDMIEEKLLLLHRIK